MIAQQSEDDLRAMLIAPDVPQGLGKRVLQALGRRRQAGAEAISFDIRASSAGVTALCPGSSTITADSRRARAFAERAREELAEYAGGLRSYFTVPVDLSAAASFQRSVLETTRGIPFGEVRSYRWIAERIGNPRAVRAVGTALGRNPVPIVVPCHRVLRSDGGLGGYAFGLDLKNRWLSLEHDTPAIVGSDTTRIVCRHGCPGERRISEPHAVVFASVREARFAGYRPCRRCHPADD